MYERWQIAKAVADGQGNLSEEYIRTIGNSENSADSQQAAREAFFEVVMQLGDRPGEVAPSPELMARAAQELRRAYHAQQPVKQRPSRGGNPV